MVKKEFRTTIDAPREKIWKILWGNETYPKWTSVFAEGSAVETDWKKGSKALFTDGKGQGMVAKIVENRENEYMSIMHIGMLKDGVEDMSEEATKGWAGAMENYTLKTVNNKTDLLVDMELAEEHKDYFNKTWPLALEKVKELAEQN